MTFNKRGADTNFQVTYTPLLEETISNQTDLLQEKFLEFNKNFEEIKDFNNRLNKLTLTDYMKQKAEIHQKISSTPVLISNINSLITTLTSTDIREPKLKSRVIEKIKIVDGKIIEKNKELAKIMDEIVEKESNLFSFKAEEQFNYESSGESLSDNPSEIQIRESQIILKDVRDNKDYIEKREKELEEIKKVSGQVMSMTVAMSAETQKQAIGLVGIEDNIIVTKDNALKAESEIKMAEKISRNSSRKMLWLVTLLCILALSIIVLVIYIFLPKENKEKKFLI